MAWVRGGCLRTGTARLEDPRHPGDDQAAEALFERVAARIVATHDLAPSLARQALDQALIFLVVAAQDAARALSPSPLVDEAWDTFILYTVGETAGLLREQGFYVLDALWPRDAAATSKANCTSCYSGDHVGDGDDG
ncbi:hypothetical protein [Nonomuraea typhae]|uniref:hypothetical protein n=1 Tax=Nonomuraea typhae TaxID=2603600 RepID=UPI0012FBC9F9|nr:hypothetical protein [Nonomuraea typhae]